MKSLYNLMLRATAAVEHFSECSNNNITCCSLIQITTERGGPPVHGHCGGVKRRVGRARRVEVGGWGGGGADVGAGVGRNEGVRGVRLSRGSD